MRAIRIFGVVAGLAAITGPAVAAGADDALERAQALARGGAPHLALQVLQSSEPPPSDGKRWMAHERRRFQILRGLKDWTTIARRADDLPDSLPADFRRAMLFEAVEARFALSDNAGARRLLRRILWRLDPPASDLAHAQRLVIRSYLLDGRLADAETALIRYREEHGRGTVWQVLHAEILMRQGNPKAAFEVLSGSQSQEARLLRQLAALRAGYYRPIDTLKAADKLADERGGSHELRRRSWALGAQAAHMLKDEEARVVRLERAVTAETQARADGQSVDTTLFPASADDLWAAYERLAERTGNRARLVVGNDEGWRKLARTHCRKNPPLARALHAFQARQAATPAEREAAHRRLVANLFADGQAPLAQALYTRSTRYPVVGDLPVAVRYRLADKALADYDIHLAAELVRGLKTPPPDDDDPEGWVLRRARILIYAGQNREAATLLAGMLGDRSPLDGNFIDRYLQVLFDLQAVGAHAEAAVLLDSLSGEVDDARLQRELLFWRADSQAGLRNHRAAAELYLRSATHNGHSGGDPWGHTARFRAAEELGKAGLTRDARDVYTRLLSVTTDPARRTVIERQLQQLWTAARQKTTP